VANSLHPSEDDNCWKALFLTLLGQGSFSKLKGLAFPTSVSNLSLDAILQDLSSHYQSKMIEIVRGLRENKS